MKIVRRRGNYATPRRRLSPTERFWSRVDTTGGLLACWPWKGSAASNGYGNFAIDGVNVGAHRAAWILTNGPIPDGLLIRHGCDVKLCVNPLHLTPGTHLDNEHDKIARGRQALGERQGLSRLTERDIATIRAADEARSTRELARVLGVSQATIVDVRTRRTWRHVA